ncbi:MAG: DNA adenine methylase [Ktedonobacteraceae bacterium]|nr:DNA adenine methylase [Ktedonobacteraceae bacterium]MBA3915326.1 DNA adenine methylase [Terriglobales bacterium]
MTGPLSYIGGKNRLAKTIIPLIPEHQTYVEPFSGGAQVFFHKEPSKVEVLNDLDLELMNFFRICQNHYQELVRYLEFMTVSRKWFDMLRKTPAETLTDVQRAARFVYLQKLAYAGRVRAQTYAGHVVQKPSYRAENLPDVIAATHARLNNVQLESLPYERILEVYDRRETFFYLDPPYWGKPFYHFNFEAEDFRVLAERLRGVQGRFILSLNDVPEVRQIFSTFTIKPLEVSYSATKDGSRRHRELLIMNFTPGAEVI